MLEELLFFIKKLKVFVVSFTLCMLDICCLRTFFQINFFKKKNSLDPDQDRHCVRPDLGSNCLQRLSADNKSRCSQLRKELKSMIFQMNHMKLTKHISFGS